jgi:long-chain acyl-CoA synthetase
MALQVEFSTICEMFDAITRKFEIGTRPLFQYKVDKTYTGIGYSEFRQNVNLFALGLASMGVKAGDKVAIISENRPEWPVADMAILGLGAINVPLYPTLTPKQIEFIFNDAAIKIVIVSNPFQLGKVQKIFSEVKTLEKVIIMSDKGIELPDNTMKFTRVLSLGREFGVNHPTHFWDFMKNVRPEDLLTIIYTSGTTGNPKGVMLTHHNMVSNIIATTHVIDINERDTLLSFLPLCHSFERMAGYYTAMGCGATIAYAESVETVRDNLLEIHPTIVTTVPRLFERIHSSIMKLIDGSPQARQKIFHRAIEIGKRYAVARRKGFIQPLLRAQYAIAAKLVFARLKERTGGKMRFFVSGGAALPRQLGEFFEAAGITIIEGYGLTETSPVLTCNRLDDYKFGTVGKAIPGVTIKIADDGEILAKGPNIMIGYYNNVQATAEMFDDQGWFHTGDVGMFDAEGHLVITDRKKHLFVSSGGKNIAPQPIESLFIQNKFIDQFVLFGDGKMFLTALIVPEFEILRAYLKGKGIEIADNQELINHGAVRNLFQTIIDETQKDLPNFERVRRFELLPNQLTVENNEITPSLKVKRKVVEKNYAHLLEGMYVIGQ